MHCNTDTNRGCCGQWYRQTGGVRVEDASVLLYLSIVRHGQLPNCRYLALPSSLPCRRRYGRPKRSELYTNMGTTQLWCSFVPDG